MPFHLPDLLLVMLGFGFIIFFHELGHYLAARWAGIRVLAFAIGFGPPLVTYRRGMGWRRGSSERDYLDAASKAADARRLTASPTEYRLNALPLGGYVKMLGQDDLDPGAISAAPDSYQNCPPWKRLIVISAGVVMNLVLAAALFIFVMMVGREVEAPRIGLVEMGSPAERATALSSGVAPGLRAGDEVLAINGVAPSAFDDIVLTTAMAEKGARLAFDVSRAGKRLSFEVVPEKNTSTGLLSIGISNAHSLKIVSPGNKLSKEDTQAFGKDFAKAAGLFGLAGVEPGMELVRVDGRVVASADEILRGDEREPGTPVGLEFKDAATGKARHIDVRPTARMMTRRVRIAGAKGTQEFSEQHFLGLTGAVRVGEPSEQARAQGLREGDVFALLGTTEYPSFAQAFDIIRTHKGGAVRIVALRKGELGTILEIDLPAVKVGKDGRIGFTMRDTFREELLVSGASVLTGGPALAPGTRIIAVHGAKVHDYDSFRAAVLRRSNATSGGGERGAITITIAEPRSGLPGAIDSAETRAVTLTDAGETITMGWSFDEGMLGLFEPARIVRKASNPLEALSAGLHDTKRMMLMTYVTFVRLAQGSVKVDQLKGPVGIAHLGTLVADRGIIWLLFFMALISVNLAVVNFLPLPIVDGGQFLFIVYEWIRGRPVPVGVQNGVTLAGLVLIGSMFLFVTYNDIRNLIGL